MKRGLIVAATVFALSSPAFAFQCPSLVAEIDEKLQTAELSDAERDQVMALRDSGEAAHNAGNHAESEADLNQALTILDQ